MYPPRVFKPQLYPPDVTIGPGGLQRAHAAVPRRRRCRARRWARSTPQAGQGMLKPPGRAARSAPTGPLLPTQGTFRQKPWLPWWLIPVLLLLALLLFLLFRSLPQNVLVPKVVGEASAFKAEEKLTKADLKLDPNQKEKVDDKVPAGHRDRARRRRRAPRSRRASRSRS